jgi:hypothetical protein
MSEPITDTDTEQSFETPGLINIGQPPGIPVKFKSETEYNNYIKTCMRVVDLMPLYFEINIGELFPEKGSVDDGSIKNEIIKLNYPWGIAEYNRKLAGIGHPDAGNLYGARLWITSQSTVSENVSNSYQENAFTTLFNGKAQEAKSALSGIFSKYGGKISDPRATGLLAGLLDAKQMSMPTIWESTDYSPSMSFTVKLTSPYGDPESYKRNIVKPLIGLLALISPSSTDGITYGLPPFFTVKAYGSMNLNLAILKDFTINRGGAETRFNAKKQPLEIEISMSFEAAVPGFGAMVGKGGTEPGELNDIVSYSNVDIPFGMGGAAEYKTTIPGVVTLGSIIESLRPAGPGAIAQSTIGGINFISNMYPDGLIFNPDEFATSFLGGLLGTSDFSTLNDIITNGVTDTVTQIVDDVLGDIGVSL